MRRTILALPAAFLMFVSALGAQPADDAGPPPEPGQWLWRFVAGGATVGSVAFDEQGRYYFAAEDRYVYAIDRHGTMIWRTDIGRKPGGSVVLGTDGTVFVTLVNGELLALNPDGRLVWRDRISSERPLDPVVLSSGVVVTVRRPATVEARTHFGRLIWTVELDAPVSAPAILAADGSILVPTTQGDLVSLSTDGRLIRKRYIGEIASTLAAGGGGSLLGSTDGRIIAVDEALEPLWRADLGSAVRELRVSVSGDIYATCDDGTLGRVTEDGVVAWKAQPGSAAMRSPVVGDDILVVTSDGLLTTLQRDGVARWQMRLLDRPLAMGVSPYGATVVATERWVTYAYQTGFAPAGSWPQERGAFDRRAVARSGDTGRVSLDAFSQSADFLAMRGLLLSGGPSDQVVTMAKIASRVERGENLAGSHHYLLELSERVAGSPYFGQLTQFGPKSAPRRARETAVAVLGEIGDLATARFLGRLVMYEPDPAMQASILVSMGRLGTPIDAELAGRLGEIVRRDVGRDPSDTLGLAVTRFVAAIDEYRGGYLDPGIADVLLAVAGANYGRTVRQEALDTLRELAGGSAP